MLPILLLLSISIESSGLTAEDSDETTIRKQAAARLIMMKRRAFSVTVMLEMSPDESTPAKIIEAPLLRYSNQAARIITADATVWAWGPSGRPVAMASLDDKGLEIVSFADMRVTLTGKSGLKWSPAKAQIVWKAVPEAAAAGQTGILRARQMKEIARRFSATGHYPDSGDLQLRLLEHHLHRYSNLAEGIVDGAIYAFAAGTNPEVIVLLECREGPEKNPLWYYGITRLSAGTLDAKLDDRPVWSCPPIGTWNPRDPYWSGSFGNADLVDESDLPSPSERPSQ